jgi:hypothetical protein
MRRMSATKRSSAGRLAAAAPAAGRCVVIVPSGRPRDESKKLNGAASGGGAPVRLGARLSSRPTSGECEADESDKAPAGRPAASRIPFLASHVGRRRQIIVLLVGRRCNRSHSFATERIRTAQQF